jgi:hypothetical protein
VRDRRVIRPDLLAKRDPGGHLALVYGEMRVHPGARRVASDVDVIRDSQLPDGAAPRWAICEKWKRLGVRVEKIGSSGLLDQEFASSAGRSPEWTVGLAL